MVQVYIPAGEFLMGSTNADIDEVMRACSTCQRNWFKDEMPQHKVYLDAFWIDQTEVTNAMFTKFISASGYRTNAEKAGQSYVYANNQFGQVKGADWQHPSGPGSNLGGKETFPAIHVNWNDAKAYCEWAGRQLPSEAQWEKAARGADGRLYPWGNQAPDNSYLNYKNFKGDTTAVKSYEQGKSPYDAYDMAGNVYEWVADWYDEKYYSSQSTWRNPGGPGSSPQGARVNRGGSWINSSGDVRAADRFGNVPANTSDFIGFRCFR
jgi:formylglycine-generating enzyme required for sulfatase activity